MNYAKITLIFEGTLFLFLFVDFFTKIIKQINNSNSDFPNQSYLHSTRFLQIVILYEFAKNKTNYKITASTVFKA